VGDEPIVSEREAFELVVYLVAAAELTLIEPELYGSFRLVDAASRLLAPLAERGRPERRAFYGELRAQIDRDKVLMMSDKDAYAEFVRRLPRALAAELRRDDGARPLQAGTR
jgi:hypothetical protein